MKKSTIAILILIIASFIIAVYAFNTIQTDRIASHWDANGNVNGYMSKFWGLFLLPVMLIGLYFMFLLIPRIDPLKKNYKKFKTYYEGFILVIILFMFYVFVLTILSNLGYVFNMSKMIMPAVALLFIIMGVFMKKLKRNWFVGIRTPWTISNDVVWEKTHVLGSKLFIAIGLITLAGMFFQEFTLWFIILPILLSTIFLIIYSYVEFKKLKR